MQKMRLVNAAFENMLLLFGDDPSRVNESRFIEGFLKLFIAFLQQFEVSFCSEVTRFGASYVIDILLFKSAKKELAVERAEAERHRLRAEVCFHYEC